ncbi:MAG TPA: hypothetical protein VHN79_09185 [Lacunisphaera sp.]|nr:hypothetical protein [Lacunisphaera sp.]
MSGEILDSASVVLPLGSNRLDETDILARDDLGSLLQRRGAARRGEKVEQ